jgi:hypothetical protein
VTRGRTTIFVKTSCSSTNSSNPSASLSYPWKARAARPAKDRKVVMMQEFTAAT